MVYRGYKIESNNTGYVNFVFYPADDCDAPITGHGKTIEDCKTQIDGILNDYCPHLVKINGLVFDNMVDLVKQHSNDQELGEQVRKLFNQ